MPLASALSISALKRRSFSRKARVKLVDNLSGLYNNQRRARTGHRLALISVCREAAIVHITDLHAIRFTGSNGLIFSVQALAPVGQAPPFIALEK